MSMRIGTHVGRDYVSMGPIAWLFVGLVIVPVVVTALTVWMLMAAATWILAITTHWAWAQSRHEAHRRLYRGQRRMR